MDLRLVRRDETLVPPCDLLGVPYLHESSKSVSVSAMFQTRTVCFVFLVILCFCVFWEIFIFIKFSEMWLEKRRVASSCMSLKYACSARSFSCISRAVLAVLTTRFTDSVDHPLAKHTLSRCW